MITAENLRKQCRCDGQAAKDKAPAATAEQFADILTRLEAVERRLQMTLEVNHLWDGS